MYGYVKFPKSFAANLTEQRIEAAQEAARMSLVNDKSLTVAEWSELNTILTMVKVGLRSEEEHAAAMKRSDEEHAAAMKRYEEAA